MEIPATLVTIPFILSLSYHLRAGNQSGRVTLFKGTEAFAYQYPDGTVAILTDYFGSCSGCDAWEDSSDDVARKMIESLVHSARLFESKNYAALWAATVEDRAEDYPFYAARNLSFQG